MEKDQIKENLKNQSTWIKGIYLFIIAVAGDIAAIVLVAIAIFQFLSMLFAGKINEQLKTFGKTLSLYIYQICLFLTFNTEERPFPFGEWPRVE